MAASYAQGLLVYRYRITLVLYLPAPLHDTSQNNISR